MLAETEVGFAWLYVSTDYFVKSMITRIYKQNLHRLENRKSYSLIGHFVCSSAVEFMTEVASFTKVASIAENSASKPTLKVQESSMHLAHTSEKSIVQLQEVQDIIDKSSAKTT